MLELGSQGNCKGSNKAHAPLPVIRLKWKLSVILCAFIRLVILSRIAIGHIV